MTRTIDAKIGCVALVLLAAACTGSDGKSGASGEAGVNGNDALIRSTPEAAGSNCADGGKKIEWGQDANGNGTLEANEVTGSTYLCNAAAAAGAMVTTTALSAGDATCPSGG